MTKEFNRQWRFLYVGAAIAAFVSITMIPVQVAFFIAWPLPTGVEEWFAIFDQNWVRGLIGLDVLLLVQGVMVAWLYLALGVALWPANRSLAVLGLAIGMLAQTVYFSSNTSFEMLDLSRQFSANSDPEIANQILGAGRGALATFKGTSFLVYYMLGAFALLIFSIAMPKSDQFGGLTARVGLVAGLLMLVPPTVGIVGMSMSLLSLVPWIVFAFLVGRRFLRLGQT